MRRRRVTIWVDPEFRKAIKKKAVDEDYSDLLSFTKDFAKELDGFSCKKKNDKKSFW